MSQILYWATNSLHSYLCRGSLLYLHNDNLYRGIYYSHSKFWYYGDDVYDHDFNSFDEAKSDLEKRAIEQGYKIIDQETANKFKMLI